MKTKIYAFFVLLIIFSSIALCAENKRTDGLGFSTGLGTTYASGVGGAVEYYYMFYPNHSLGLLAGIGQSLSIGYAGTLRYAYGSGDRFICDLTIGMIGQEEEVKAEYNFETHEWEDKKTNVNDIYSPSMSIGYQRITDFGLTVTITLGASLASSIAPLESPEIWPTFSLALGYKL